MFECSEPATEKCSHERESGHHIGWSTIVVRSHTLMRSVLVAFLLHFVQTNPNEKSHLQYDHFSMFLAGICDCSICNCNRHILNRDRLTVIPGTVFHHTRP